jgi:hypothetical protein
MFRRTAALLLLTSLASLAFAPPVVAASPFTQRAKLHATDGGAADLLGFSVAVSGNTVVVGEPYDDGNTGSVYVFTKGAGGWANMTETARLTASDRASSDNFGYSVAISGDTIVVGAYNDSAAQPTQGSAYVYVKPAAGWATTSTQTAKLTAANPVEGDWFGWSVAISGGLIAVGQYGGDVGSALNVGSAFVFVKPAGGWVTGHETARLHISDGVGADYGTGFPGDGLGYSIAISGDVIASGAIHRQGATFDSGAVFVFKKPAAGWANGTEAAVFWAAAGAAKDLLGTSVGISGNTIVAGAPDHAVGGHMHQGAAYVFAKSAGGWTNATEVGVLTASDGAAEDRLASVAVSGDTIAAGAAVHKVGTNGYQGAIYVFNKPGAGWGNAAIAPTLVAADGAFGDELGYSVGLSGDTIVAGAVADDFGTTSNQGSAYVFERPASASVRKPDGLIKVGTGAAVGNNVYNTTGAGQSKTGSATRGHAITFSITVQNDGTGAADTFKLKATGSASGNFTVAYFKGATDITSQVVAGTYTTSPLAPGASLAFTAKVTVKPSAAASSSVSRLLTITSVGDGTKKDAVKFVGKRS